MTPGDKDWGQDPDRLQIHTDETSFHETDALAGDQRELYRRLAEALSGEGANPIRPVEALAVMAVIEAAAQSAREKRAVPLPLTEEEKAAY